MQKCPPALYRILARLRSASTRVYATCRAEMTTGLAPGGGHNPVTVPRLGLFRRARLDFHRHEHQPAKATGDRVSVRASLVLVM